MSLELIMTKQHMQINDDILNYGFQILTISHTVEGESNFIKPFIAVKKKLKSQGYSNIFQCISHVANGSYLFFSDVADYMKKSNCYAEYNLNDLPIMQQICLFSSNSGSEYKAIKQFISNVNEYPCSDISAWYTSDRVEGNGWKGYNYVYVIFPKDVKLIISSELKI